MSIPKKLLIPIILATVSSVIITIDALFKIQVLSGLASTFKMFGILMATFTLLVGVVSTLLKHTKVILQKKENWPFSLWLVFLLCFMLVMGLVPPTGSHPWFKWVFNNLQRPIDIGMYALLPCYLFYVAYKGFRIRGVESALFVAASFFLMMTHAPIGYAIWPGLPVIGKWVQSVPGLAGSRGIMIGISLGLMYLLVRVILGREKAIAGG